MGGKVIQALRASLLAPSLTEAELRALANCGRQASYASGETILAADGLDERLFVLGEGQVQLTITMWSEGGHCGGEAAFELSAPGEPFGWAMWVRSDRIAVAAYALQPTTLIALDLDRLGDAETFLKVQGRMLQSLYGRLQEAGICPPSIQGMLRLKHLLYT